MKKDRHNSENLSANLSVLDFELAFDFDSAAVEFPARWSADFESVLYHCSEFLPEDFELAAVPVHQVDYQFQPVDFRFLREVLDHFVHLDLVHQNIDDAIPESRLVYYRREHLSFR